MLNKARDLFVKQETRDRKLTMFIFTFICIQSSNFIIIFLDYSEKNGLFSLLLFGMIMDFWFGKPDSLPDTTFLIYLGLGLHCFVHPTG